MDIHDRLLNVPTENLILPYVLDDDDENERTVVIKSALKACNEKLSTNCLDVKGLETLRMILCYEYQTFIKFGIQLQYNKYNKSKIDVKTLLSQNIDNFIDSEPFALLYDVVVLQLAFSFDEKKPIETFDEIYESLEINPKMTRNPCQCLRAFESIVDAHNLHLRMNGGVRQNVEFPKIPSCIPKAMLSWMEDKAHPEWPKLASLLPELVRIFGTSNTIDPLWTGILTSKRLTIDRILEALCTMADICFPPEIDSTREIRYDYSISGELWSVLCRALDSPASSDRTKALFLIKKVSGFVGKHELEIWKNFDVSKAEMVPFIRKNDRTRSNSTAAFRQTYFAIMQSLENKQKHMVIPVFKWASELVETFTIQNHQGYIFHKKWMQCMYKGMLRHNEQAVRKEAFREILATDIDIFDESFLDFLAKRLRELALYEFDYSEEESPQVVQQLGTFFWRCERDKMPWIKVFIRSISKLTWSSVSLHWILKSFVIAIDEKTQIVHNAWTEEELTNMNKLVTTNLTKRYTLSPVTRPVLHEILRLYISPQSKWKDVGLVVTAIQNITGLEKIDVPAEHMQQMISSEDAQKYIIQECDTFWPEQSSETFAKTIIALIFSNMIFPDAECQARPRLHALFEKTNCELCRIRPEMPSKLKVLELASFLMKKCRVLNHWMCPLLKLKRFLLRQMPNWVEIVESFTTYREILPEHTKITIALIKYNAADHVEYLNHFYVDCALLLGQDPALIGRDRWVFALRVIYTYHRRYYHKEKLTPPRLSKSQLQLVIRYFQTDILDAYSSDKKVLEKCCKAIAQLIADYFEPGNPPDQTETSLCLNELRFLVDRAPRVTTLIAIKLIVQLLQPTTHDQTLNDENTDIVLSLIHAMCRMVFDFETIRKETLSLRLYAKLISRSYFLEHEGSTAFAAKWVKQLVEQGSDMPEMKTAFVTSINDPEMGIIFIQSLVRCFFSGIAPDAEQRIENLASGLYGPEGEVDYPEDKIIVAYTVIAVMDLSERVVGMKSAFREKVLEGLLGVLKNHRNVVYGYNSVVHKIKCRAYRALLVMVSYLDENETRRLYNEVCTLLILESNQESVRLLQEWLVVRIYTQTLKDKSIWNVFKLGMEKHPENIVCIVSVIFQIAKVLENAVQVQFINDAISYLLPYSMGHRFNQRLSSKIHWVLVTLHDMLPANFRFRFSNVFESLRAKVLEETANNGGNDLTENFWFKEFHAIEDLNLEMIFEHMPRLTGAPLDERIEVGIFDALMDPEAYEEVEVYSLEKWREMKATKSTLKSIRGGAGDNDERNREGFVADVQDRLQRFRTIGPVTDDLSDAARIEYERKIALKSPSGIIVVATLVSRLRHLGQLAKTCEVFAAKELVISSAKYTEREAFKNMSSSAEKLIKITEIRKDRLKDYLIKQRSKGWKVVGAQRVDGSSNVLDTEFDKKTILLLGNENKGIPEDLLPLCDICVTIPGHGVIRSLNIQVAGAICIWQYAKQHTFSQL